MRRIIATGLLAIGGWLALETSAAAQEIQLTGPLAGAPAVRELRWHHKGRFEIAPTVSFTLLDEYQRTIFAGGRLSYYPTDWLGIGVWGAYGVTHMNTALTDEIEKVNAARWDPAQVDQNAVGQEQAARNQVDRNASRLSVGKNFPKQVGQMEWIVSPQVMAIPFRGKLALFQKIFVDTDLYFFGGPAFIGVKERKDYDVSQLTGTDQIQYPMASRVAVAPTFGLGLSFFPGRWTGFGIEYRALPFAWNTSGFDSRGGPPDSNGPDFKVDSKDRQFKFNQMISLSFSVFLPQQIKQSP